MKILKVTLIATVAGTAAWYLGIARMAWPAHPYWADFLISLALTLALQYAWPDPKPTGQR
jgi:hypothetical protein